VVVHEQEQCVISFLGHCGQFGGSSALLPVVFSFSAALSRDVNAVRKGAEEDEHEYEGCVVGEEVEGEEERPVKRCNADGDRDVPFVTVSSPYAELEPFPSILIVCVVDAIMIQLSWMEDGVGIFASIVCSNINACMWLLLTINWCEWHG